MAFAIDEAEVVNGVEVQVAGTYNEYVGTVASGTSITNVAWVLGSGDRNYASGALTRVYIPVSAERENRIVEWGLVHADQDGTLKAGAVDNAAVLADNVVETAKITDRAATLPKIDGGSTAGVLKTNASGVVTVGAKTTDANGWTVYDYGAWKEYSKKTANSSASKAQYEAWDLYTETLPVGVASTDVKDIQVTVLYIDYVEFVGNVSVRFPSSSTLALRAANFRSGTATYQYACYIRITV